MRGLKVLCGAVVLVAFFAPGANADEWDKKTFLTFSGPVQIPGATLPAGTYTFEIANPNTTRHVIRVSEKDTNKHVGLFMTIPNYRQTPPDDNLIMFSERPAGQPQAIQVWYYPGDSTGEEFVYPKSQAMKIAKATHKTVLATNDESSANASESERMAAMKGASIGRVDENGRMTEESKTANAAPATTTAPGATTTAPSTTAPKSSTASSAAATTTAPANTVNGSRASRATTAPSSTANRGVATSGSQDNAGNNRRSLPRTASNLSLFELLSALSIGGGFAVRRLRLARAL